MEESKRTIVSYNDVMVLDEGVSMIIQQMGGQGMPWNGDE